MPENYYPPTDEEESNLPPDDAGKPNTDAQTALVPKEFLGTVAVGDTMTVKVVHVYEDEVEVERVNEESKETEPAAPSYESEIDEMATEQD